MRLRHLQWAVIFLAVAMAVGFPAFRRGSRARATATFLAMGPRDVEADLVLSKPVLQEALSDPLYRLADQPGLKGSSDPEKAIAEAVRVSLLPGTNLVEIAADADTRAEATAIVDAVLVSYLRTRPIASIRVVQDTTAVSSAWGRPYFAAYVALMVAALGMAIAWFAVLIRMSLRVRRQSREGRPTPHLPSLPGA